MQERSKRAISGIVYIAIMWLGASYSELSYRLLFGILGVICIYEMSKLRKEKTKIVAFSYIIIPFIILQLLDLKNNNIFDPSIILFIFIITWTFDTFAYLIGTRFGRNKIMPSISPNKSWEGFFGGFIFSIITGYITNKYLIEVNIKLATIMSILIPFTATLGDFIESKYKREKGVKDSGSLIPGHGGILDRMDAFMITIPTLYIINNIL